MAENNVYQKEELQGFVEQDTALESMRASDFDCYSAYGEVIDNSIQANATDIRLQFEERKDRQNTSSKKIGRVLFADNGHGMDVDLLHKCLKLGHSSRYNDRSGIGRFGVGMTLGAIHECRRIEVYSKTASGSWHFTYLDLDEIKAGTLKHLPKPIPKKPEEDIINYIKDSGTLVIWSKYDKQIDKFEEIISESHFWIGRTFRRYIWGIAKDYDRVSISLNDKIVKAFDPLFVNKDLTGFEGEEAAELFPTSSLDWIIPVNEGFSKQKSKILINMSRLPESYTRKRGAGGDNFAKERYIDRNIGISIIRNDREVFFGKIPNFKTGDKNEEENIDRFIGCEISFNAELDQEFAVKNIKRGAVPVRELKAKILELVSPTFNYQREIIRNSWNEKAREDENIISSENADIGVSGTHSTTNRILRESREALLKNNKVNKAENDVKIARKVNPEAEEDQIQKVILALKENGITIDEREFIGDAFIDIEHGNGLKTIFYNTNSTFYKAYSEILNELKEENAELANKYRVLMDLIFVGYMLAESTIDPNDTMDGASFADEIKSYWSINLSKILKRWSH
jgi:hypothetical protein